MTARQVLLAWLLGPLLLAGASICAWWIQPMPEARFEGAQVAAIGSSLTAHLLPERDSLPDGRRLRRYGLTVPSEGQMLTLLDAAIAERVPVVLLEASPFLVDFAFESEKGCAAPAQGPRFWLRRQQVALVDSLRRLSGRRTTLEGMAEPENLNSEQAVDPIHMATHYPLRLHQPCRGAWLAASVARAKAQGTRIVLLLPPRAPVGEALLGVAQSRQLLIEARQLSQLLGLPLFVPAGSWADAEFTDHAHVNAAGRAHFGAELARFLGLTH